MTTRFLIYILLGSCLLGGCRKDSGAHASPASTAAPTVAPTPVIDAKTAFGSPEAMTTFLEQRWPLAAIKAFCVPERRHNNMYQNLVKGFDGPVIWEGALYQGIPTGLDKIAWFANTKGGRVTNFSVGVERGDDFWLLEIGSEEAVRTPPDYLPDPNSPWFIGHK